MKGLKTRNMTACTGQQAADRGFVEGLLRRLHSIALRCQPQLV
ncbi:MAG: hypothetical protein ACK58L_20565 [Planctomycetota bacterium]